MIRYSKINRVLYSRLRDLSWEVFKLMSSKFLSFGTKKNVLNLRRKHEKLSTRNAAVSLFHDRHDYTYIHYTHMFSRDFRLSGSESAGNEISTIVDKLMPRRMIYPPRKAAWKVALWAPHRRSAASRGGGGFDLVIACREEWEMSPGGDERTDLRQVGESTASLFCSGPTTAHKPPGPTWGWIVLAASLVLLDDVSAYFKRIGTFHRGKTFRRETKLHHRKNVSALRKEKKKKKKSYASSGERLHRGKARDARRLLRKKGFLTFVLFGRKTIYHGRSLRYESRKDP